MLISHMEFTNINLLNLCGLYTIISFIYLSNNCHLLFYYIICYFIPEMYDSSAIIFSPDNNKPSAAISEPFDINNISPTTKSF